MTTPCILCGNKNNNQLYTIKELQFGLDEYFEYQLCGSCGSMQLQNIPVDLSKYYLNENYYSFRSQMPIRKKADRLRKIKTDYLLFGKNKILGGLLSIGYKMPEQYEWVKCAGVKYTDAILDVGTGSGNLLARLFQIGFQNLTGIDPFIDSSQDQGAVKILKKDIYDVEDQYDLVMMHHSLEHMSDPLSVLQQVMKITKPGGCLLVRLPIMGNYGWQRYGLFWCGIDAPRHIFIPSEKEIKRLGEKAGFVVEKFYYDSASYTIWACEQYKKGISLHDPRSYMINPKASMFTKKEISGFRTILKEEDIKGNGDSALILFRKP